MTTDNRAIARSFVLRQRPRLIHLGGEFLDVVDDRSVEVSRAQLRRELVDFLRRLGEPREASDAVLVALQEEVSRGN
ncbi:MAG: hypothetical protein AAGD00_04720 [Planctomycetota bacterium]